MQSQDGVIFHLDRWEDTTFNHIKKSEQVRKSFQLTFHGQPIYDFGTIKVKLYNFNDRSFKGVSAFVELIPQDSDSLFEMEVDAAGPNEVREAIKRIEEKEIRHTAAGSLKYGYFIPLANPADDNLQPFFDFGITVHSQRKPLVNVTITSENDNLVLVSYDYNHSKRSFFQSDLFQTLMIILGIVIVLFVEVKLLNAYWKIRREKWITYLKEELTKRIESGKLALDSEAITDTYEYLSNEFDYYNAWKITRWLKKMKKPVEKTGTAGMHR